MTEERLKTAVLGSDRISAGIDGILSGIRRLEKNHISSSAPRREWPRWTKIEGRK